MSQFNQEQEHKHSHGPIDSSKYTYHIIFFVIPVYLLHLYIKKHNNGSELVAQCYIILFSLSHLFIIVDHEIFFSSLLPYFYSFICNYNYCKAIHFSIAAYYFYVQHEPASLLSLSLVQYAMPSCVIMSLLLLLTFLT